MTTHALMELADMIDKEIAGYREEMTDVVHCLLSEAATQLRTAAAEGGEAVYQYRFKHKGSVHWAVWQEARSEQAASEYAEMYARDGFVSETRTLYLHPPTDSGAGRDGMVLVPSEPTEAQWSGLARDVVMWMNAYDRHSSETLLKHLDRCGTEIPDWLRKEADTGPHSLPKGSIAAIIYKAMIDTAIAGAAGGGRG